jgi:hypothetical protein
MVLCFGHSNYGQHGTARSQSNFFLRLLALLKNEYNLDFSESLSSENDLETIKTELQNLQSKMGEVLKGIEELKGMMKK